MLHEGTATMRANNALTPDEVDEGWVLTCQAEPTSTVGHRRVRGDVGVEPSGTGFRCCGRR